MVLLVHPNGSKYWRLRYHLGCKEKMLALGKYPEVSLADARVSRDETGKLLANGVDLSENKKTVKMEHEHEHEHEHEAVTADRPRQACQLSKMVCFA